MEYLDVGTPLSNKYYLGFAHGEMYGLDHSMQRFLPDAAMHLRAKTDIPGLYLTGKSARLITIFLSGIFPTIIFHDLTFKYFLFCVL